MPHTEIYRQLSLLTAILSTLLSLALLSHANNKSRNRYLALTMLIPAVLFWCRYLIYTGSSVMPYLALILFPIIWYQGPFFLRYTELCIEKSPSLPALRYILPVLAIGSMVIHCAMLLLFPEFHNLNLIMGHQGLIGQYTAVYLLCVCSFNVYIFIHTIRLHWIWNITDDNNPNADSHKTKNWLVLLGSLLLLNYIIYGGSALLLVFDFLHSPLHLFEIGYNTIVVLLILFLLLQNSQILQQRVGVSQKYARQTIPTEEADSYRTKLLNYMQKERPYLQEDLKLKQLAELTGIPAHHLSIVINRDFGQNWFNFLAEYRVAEAQRQLADPQLARESLLAICYSAGFQSKSAFNSAFKRITGITPTEFRKQQITKNRDS